MRFAAWGWPELIKFSLIGIAVLVGGVLVALPVEWPWLGWPLALAGLGLFLFVLNFFRDPDRPLSGGPLDIISPADGTVTDAGSSGQGGPYVTGKAHVVGIFLSVFDVHVNRSPLDGQVDFLLHKPGQYLDARHPDCGKLNEMQIVGLRLEAAGGAKAEVRQIAGLIARRIICPLAMGARLGRGERYGMIKFGSRTELWIDAEEVDVEWLVKPGDKVKGGLTVIGRLVPKASE